MSDRDYYEILGLTPTADGAMVDQAYWHLARKYQGLATTNPRAQFLLDELNEAYGVLGNPKLREQYDAFRDDVLIRKGMVKPVKAKPHAAARRAEAGEQTAREPRSWNLPTPRLAHARTYCLAVIIAALAFAGAWQGVNVVFVIAAMGVGLVLSLTPAVTGRLSQMQLSMPTMPSMPQVAMPQIQAPKLGMPSLPEIQVPQLPAMAPPARDEMDADELRASTAATIARWRASVGLKMTLSDTGESAPPSTELVDIVRSEREIEADSEPLNAVLEILRGSHHGTKTRN